jgi:predicted lysophospholipase L1 biosynthesis ABC-type transport system permease subunit
MSRLLADLRFAVRALRAHRLTTAIAVVCLALGVGASTAVFSVVRAVLLDALPYRAPERLVRIHELRTRQGVRDRYSASAPNFQDWRAGSRTLAAAAAYTFASRNLDAADGAEPMRLRVVRGTPELFAVLGARPQVGRAFSPQSTDDRAVVLSDRLWRARFGADRGVLGTTVRLDGEPFTVVGVMPPAFDFPVATEHTDAWVPMVLDASRENMDRTSYWLSVVGRLRDGATLDAARADLDAVTARIRSEHPELGASFGSLVEPLSDGAVRTVRPALLLLSGAVALVLLVACGNVANLLLARAEGRRREIAIRAALGASRWRLARQFLTESVVLSLAGGLAGVLLAFAAVRAAASDVPVFDVATMERVVAASLLTRRLTLTLIAGFAALALALAAAGLYGVVSYGVAQRRRELGIRMALGARGADVARLVVGEALALGAWGLAAGVALAAAGSRVLAGLLYEVTAADPLTFVAVAAVLGVTVLAASGLPARRAARVDPAVTLRAE